MSTGTEKKRRTLRSAAASTAALGLMILGLGAVYCPPQLLAGRETLVGYDYQNIHVHRIRYAQEALLSPEPQLPAWYTRELFGSPFWSNIQSFPFLPTRLLLLGLDPNVLYPVAVNLAAILAAIFTYLYGRKLGLRRIAAAAAGWTFGASGYFASRVLSGHLPLLEVFGALPLLLWILECIAQSDRGDRRLPLRYAGLAIAAFSIVLAGHPQIPTYALATAGIYALARMPLLRALHAGLAMLSGIGLSGFAWWPMLGLIGRSTRVLALEPAQNDVAFPYWRLDAFLFPWADGWAPAVRRFPVRSFVDPNLAIFGDTVVYVGWIPLIGVLVLLAHRLWTRTLPSRPWLILALVGVGALLLSFPPSQALFDRSGATLLRSPSRLLYLTTFALAMASGAFVDFLLQIGRGRRPLLASVAAALALAVHAADLTVHDRHFVQHTERRSADRREVEAWRRAAGDQRVAVDYSLRVPFNRLVDDVGFFDSILLARPYRAILAMLGVPERTNIQSLNGSNLPAAVLRDLGVSGVVTKRPQEDASAIEAGVEAPAPRAAFFPDAQVELLDESAILDRFRQERFDLRRTTMLPPGSRPPDFGADPASSTVEPRVSYGRPESDRIVVRVNSEVPGYLRVLESFDEGWSATVDGAPAPVVLADAFLVAVRVPPGAHEVRFVFRTPGAREGLVLTAASAVVLAGLALLWRRRTQGNAASIL